MMDTAKQATIAARRDGPRGDGREEAALTPLDIERAVGAYLRRGKGDEIAGHCRSMECCPVANSLKSSDMPRLQVRLGTMETELNPGDMNVKLMWTPARVELRGERHGERIFLTSRVTGFIEAIDREGTNTVTKARCRELWRQAKESAA